jgi:hypothetical protein
MSGKTPSDGGKDTIAMELNPTTRVLMESVVERSDERIYPTVFAGGMHEYHL